VNVQGQMQERDFMTLEYCRKGDLYEFVKQYLEV
jgi:hypothetical protein